MDYFGGNQTPQLFLCVSIINYLIIYYEIFLSEKNK